MNQQIILLLATTIFFTRVYSQTTLYTENFTGQNIKGALGSGTSIMIDSAGGYWSVDTINVNFKNASDYIQVVNEKIEFRDTEGNAKWTSPAISITNQFSPTLSIDLSEARTAEGSDSLSI